MSDDAKTRIASETATREALRERLRIQLGTMNSDSLIKVAKFVDDFIRGRTA